MRSPFEKKSRTGGPSNREVQNIRRRANQGPAINKADERAHAALPKDGSEELTGYPLLPDAAPTDPRHPARKGETDAARQRADEAHNRNTNAAVDAAHTRGDNAHFRATNGSLDIAHVKAENADFNAEGRLSRTGGGVVDGVMRADAFRAQFVCAAAAVAAGGTVSYIVGAKPNHITMAQIFDGTNGWAPLPTVGSGTVYVLTNNDTTFTIKNTRTIGETVRARLWQDPSS